MIIDKTPLPNDPTPADAPPAYDIVTAGAAVNPHGDLKKSSPGSPSSPAFASGSGSNLSLAPANSARLPSSSGPGKGKGRAQWFNFVGSKTSKDVKSTTLGLIRDLVREEFHSPAAFGILQSCAEACTSNGISFSSILQEKSIEGHTPLYWVIVKRKPDESIDDGAQVQDLLTALLSHSAPLSHATVSDIRHACLITSDQPLFQRLRQSPDFNSGTPVDELLIGVTLPPDDVEVVNFPDDEGSFAVEFGIVKFQKRMMIAKNIAVEFIARSRMWRLSFFVVPENDTRAGRRPGSWCVSLSLMEHSPPTWVDSRLSVEDPGAKRGSSKPKPTISMRLKSPQPLTPSYRGSDGVTEIVVAFEDSIMGTSLQYSQSSYIAPDEKLRIRLEARLSKPDNECIIC